MFKYNLGDKVLYNDREYEIIRRSCLDILDEEPCIRYMIKNGDKRIFNVEEQELSTIPRFTIKVIDNEDNNECVYYATEISQKSEYHHLDDLSLLLGKRINLQFEQI